MPTIDMARLIAFCAVSRRPSLPACRASLPSGAPGRSARVLNRPPRRRPGRRSKLFLGRCEKFSAVLVLVGEILPDRLRERLPFLERRVVEIRNLRPGLGINTGDRDVIRHGAVDSEFFEI